MIVIGKQRLTDAAHQQMPTFVESSWRRPNPPLLLGQSGLGLHPGVGNVCTKKHVKRKQDWSFCMPSPTADTDLFFNCHCM